MLKTTLAVKIDPKVAQKVRRYCRDHGFKQSFFVEKALLEQVEREELAEDLLDIKRLKAGEKDAVPLEDYLRMRHV